ncbi:hypothetical protein N4T42_07050 [Riemerella anatipestifer]|uniref:hypothetical protein n=2 Tax=Riemerella anatipestifer TaxID=34085 RepID=UPI0021D5B365|nr:hypothetical protein [Riemerella anatipestifer]MCU7560044.1 hypothetical protein [Riemerella anatipestifer]
MNALSLRFNNHLFRCSQLGKLMVGVNPALTPNQERTLIALREKMKASKITDKQIQTYGDLLAKKNQKPELSASVKTHLSDIHKGVAFGRDNHITNKYLDKGIQVEEKSISLYTRVTGKLFMKNEKHFSNDFIKGTPDNIQGKVRDIKSSWSFKTFPLYAEETPTKDYEWQVQGYMELTGLKEAELVYCLIDTPFKIVEDELRRLDWKENIFNHLGEVREECIDLVTETVSNLIYTEEGLEDFCSQSTSVHKDWFSNFHEVPELLRVKVFHFQYDKTMIEALYEQIKKCREHLNKLTLSMADRLELMA